MLKLISNCHKNESHMNSSICQLDLLRYPDLKYGYQVLKASPWHDSIPLEAWNYTEKTAYFSLESFCRTMLSLSRSLRSCLGALSTIATVRNQVSLLQLSKNGGRNGESVDICRNMSIAGDMKGWNL